MDDQHTTSAVAGRRIAAALVDITLWAVILTLAALRFGSYGAGPNGVNISLTGSPFLVYVLLLLGYYTLCEWLWSRTLGKHVVGLLTVGPAGGRITFVQSLVRNVLRCIDGFPYFIPYLLGFVVLTVNPRKQRLGDLVARTYVTRCTNR